MAADYAPRAGDYVRVTTDVVLLSAEPMLLGALGNAEGVRGYRARYDGIEVVVPADSTIEKIDPPVETFGPGAFVRGKAAGGRYLVTDKGYVNLRTGAHRDGCVPFTSEHFERVEYTEAPF